MEISKTLGSKSGLALLFDMDGTLTEARKEIQQDTVDLLKQLCDRDHLVCVVSGSPFSYISEQLRLEKTQYDKSLYLMPCNGTQIYSQNDSSGVYEQTYKVTMRDHLAAHSSLSEPHKELVHNILELQLYAMRRYDFPTTGNFVSDRGSMINWSPIGRDASHEVRATFSAEDNKKDLRKHLCDCLRVRLDASDLRTTDLALGGSTSIDIFPRGWDKTYALQHIDPQVKVWFWGDKCQPGGNDHALWAHLQPESRSFEVKSPDEALRSVRELIDKGVL